MTCPNNPPASILKGPSVPWYPKKSLSDLLYIQKVSSTNSATMPDYRTQAVSPLSVAFTLPPGLNHDAATGLPLGTASVSPTFSDTAASPFSFFSS